MITMAKIIKRRLLMIIIPTIILQLRTIIAVTGGGYRRTEVHTLVRTRVRTRVPNQYCNMASEASPTPLLRFVRLFTLRPCRALLVLHFFTIGNTSTPRAIKIAVLYTRGDYQVLLLPAPPATPHRTAPASAQPHHIAPRAGNGTQMCAQLRAHSTPKSRRTTSTGVFVPRATKFLQSRLLRRLALEQRDK